MTLSSLRFLSLPSFALFLALGCQDAQRYETEKPVIEPNTEESVQEEANELATDLSEATSDAVDSVTPDESIVDIQTPFGDVEVGKDPATGDTNVDVDTSSADVDVSSEK